ncbi:endo-1,4-beta-xylanase [Bacillus cereus group sp. BfR-BA-01524]|uniref:endo-1,4-beta-xylanase n=1 Tax=Bacillus cereus group sp. BfR-BA-01524 TaxID=2920372 RepID=UPI001F56E6FA
MTSIVNFIKTTPRWKRILALFILASLFCIVFIYKISESKEPLRELAQEHELLIGTAINTPSFLEDATYKEVVNREFNVVTLENELKFKNVHPQIDKYDFSAPNRLIDFAIENNQKVRGHTLVWSYALPDWITKGNLSKEQLRGILKNHIQTVVSQYKGKVYAWDVVNEVFNEDGTLQDNIWLRNIGPEYIELAFRWAHEADPSALLFYNDNGNDELNKKSDAIYNLFKDYKKRDVPIHGIGFQMHKSIDKPIKYEEISKNMERLSSVGLKVEITEMDVQIRNRTESLEKSLEKQAKIYEDTLNICLSNKNCNAFIMWGFTDKYTWVRNYTGKDDYPLIFDDAYKPKQAYNAIRDTLSR